MKLKIREAAAAAGVSVRTLHHYDQIGLLQPGKTEANGYRLYIESDMEKLQQIMFFRELGFSLSEIRTILGSPDFDRKHAFKSQHQLLLKKRERLDSMIQTLENTINYLEDGKIMTNDKRFDAFDASEIEAHRKKYAAEVEEMYGGSNAFRESSARTSSYTEEDWKRITEEADSIKRDIADLMEQGSDSPEVSAAVARWQKHISKYYYNCSIEILRGLGEMYAADERFKNSIDKTRTGLAEFMSEAIKHYCESAGK